MDIVLYFKGILVGLAIAAPIGPINLILVTRTLSDGRKIGWISGLGAVAADVIYGCVAVLGLSLISVFLTDNQIWFRVIGGLVLILIGLRTALKRQPKPANDDKSSRRFAHTSAFSSVFLFNIMNPMTIINWMAIIVGVVQPGEPIRQRRNRAFGH